MKSLRRIVIAVLGFLGIGAVAGAIPMILDPSGKMMGLPHSFLDHSPFRTFLLPGIILLLANGFLSLAIMILAIRRSPGYGWWVTFQGCVLTGWISVEVIMMRLVVWPHYLYWALGLVLILTGLALRGDARTD